MIESLREDPKKPDPPCKRKISFASDSKALYRFSRRKIYLTFRKRYVKRMMEKRKGVCLGHGCCDLSVFHRNRKCLDPKDRTKCLVWDNLPKDCMIYPFDEKDKIPETRDYCTFHWD